MWQRFRTGALVVSLFAVATSVVVAATFITIEVPCATLTQARGINNHGHIVGSGGTHGFLLDHGSFTTIDVPGAALTYARGINNRGQIVGRYEAGGNIHAFLLDDGSFTTIDVPDATITQA